MTLYSIPANGSNGLRSGDFRVALNLPYQCGGTEVVIAFFLRFCLILSVCNHIRVIYNTFNKMFLYGL
jgi:hypothetical protein